MAGIPEFDQYVRDKSNDDPDSLKGLLGKNHHQYIHAKAKWLWRFLTDSSNRICLDGNYRLLDYGCGAGEFLRWLKIFGFPGQLQGVDISREMLKEAETRWDSSSECPFSCIAETRMDFADNSFSCIVAASVFHHIAPDKRGLVLAEIKRTLIPDGIVVIFEHNPLNPLTRLIVKRAVVDKNAILLYPREMKQHLLRAGFRDISLKYITFFPPRISTLQQKLEGNLSWCPLGAQYALVGRRGK